LPEMSTGSVKGVFINYVLRDAIIHRQKKARVEADPGLDY